MINSSLKEEKKNNEIKERGRIKWWEAKHRISSWRQPSDSANRFETVAFIYISDCKEINIIHTKHRCKRSSFPCLSYFSSFFLICYLPFFFWYSYVLFAFFFPFLLYFRTPYIIFVPFNFKDRIIEKKGRDQKLIIESPDNCALWLRFINHTSLPSSFPFLSFRSLCLCLPSNNNPRNSLVWIEYPYFVRGKALSDDRRYDLLRDARERGKLKFQSRNEKASKRISL